MPGDFIPNRRTALGAEARAEQEKRGGFLRLPTPWAKLAPGDRLWVQEEIAVLIDLTYGEVTKTFYKMELPGGHVPIPGGAKRARWLTKSIEARKCTREQTRYWLEITDVSQCRARDVTQEQMRREGTNDIGIHLNEWWPRYYGIVMPLAENPAVIGLGFKFIDAHIDTGMRWELPAPPAPKNPDYLKGILEGMDKRYGTPPVND